MRRLTAFTLMEMILVVVIIGLLAALVLPRVVGWGEKARIAAAKAQIGSFKTALGGFERAVGRFPSTSEGLRALIEKPPNLPEGVEWERFLDESVIPQDPWAGEYVYRSPGAVNPDYDLFSRGPDGQEGTDDDIGNTRR
jgi:general secretion pathway protein G